MDTTIDPPATTSICGGSATGTPLSPAPGSPISPIILSNGTMVAFATAAPGYIFAFYADDLTFVGRTRVNDVCSITTPALMCDYETANTPAASYNAPNRFYVSMNAYQPVGAGYHGRDGWGLLVAFEADPTTGITKKWSYPFGGPSGQSPYVMQSGTSNSAIFFDGMGPTTNVSTTPTFFKITDTGASYTYNWDSATATIPGDFPRKLVASPTLDTARGCLWAYSFNYRYMQCVDTTASAYTVDAVLDTFSIVNNMFPGSALTMAYPSSGNPKMILGGYFLGLMKGRVVAIDMGSSGGTFSPSLYWSVQLQFNAEFAPTQFPIITNPSTSNAQVATPSNEWRVYLISQ